MTPKLRERAHLVYFVWEFVFILLGMPKTSDNANTDFAASGPSNQNIWLAAKEQGNKRRVNNTNYETVQKLEGYVDQHQESIAKWVLV